MSNVIESIGALELNQASVLLSDGRLEATAVDVGPTATVTANHPFTYCPRIDDGELETAAAMIASPSFDTVCASTIGRRCLRDSAN